MKYAQCFVFCFQLFLLIIESGKYYFPTAAVEIVLIFNDVKCT